MGKSFGLKTLQNSIAAELFKEASSGREKPKECPNKLLVSAAPGETLEVRCRRCDYCVRVRRRECVGRVLSETLDADRAYFCTLTYGRDDQYRLYRSPLMMVDEATGEVLDEEPDCLGEHRHAHGLFYKDVQIWYDRVRNNLVKDDGGKPSSFRYFTCGEFGPKKGRSHWHLVVLLRNCEIPGIRYYERYIHDALSLDEAIASGHRYRRRKPLWQDGWSYWEPLSELRVGYVMKYMGKQWQEQGCASVAHGSGALGIGHYRALARQYVEQGLSPTNSMYQIPGHVARGARMTPKGVVTYERPEYFPMTRAVGARFIRAFVDGWRELHGNEKWPASEWVARGVERELDRQWRTERLERLREEGADISEYGTVGDQMALKEVFDRRGERDRYLLALRPGPAANGYNHYEAMSRGW